jgi:hypothetical protein
MNNNLNNNRKMSECRTSYGYRAKSRGNYSNAPQLNNTYQNNQPQQYNTQQNFYNNPYNSNSNFNNNTLNNNYKTYKESNNNYNNPSQLQTQSNLNTNYKRNNSYSNRNLTSNNNINNNNNYPNNLYNYDEYIISDEDNLICPNCTNEALSKAKKQREQAEYNYYNQLTPGYGDNLRGMTQKYYDDRVKQRQLNQLEAANNLDAFTNKEKENLIRINENSNNYLRNPDYKLINFHNKFDEKERYINDNIDKFQNKERPEIQAYFNAYVNNPNYRPMNYGDYIQPNINLERYRQELMKQIELKNRKKLEEEEQENKAAQAQYERIQKQINDDLRLQQIRDQQQKDELLRANLKLADEKRRRKLAEEEEDRKYKEQMDNLYLKEKENEENRLKYEQFKRDELLRSNLNNIQLYKNRLQKEKEEDDKYRYVDSSFWKFHEKMGRCCKCHKIFPRKMLSINQYFYSNNRI